jgi:hypothetical protein
MYFAAFFFMVVGVLVLGICHLAFSQRYTRMAMRTTMTPPPPPSLHGPLLTVPLLTQDLSALKQEQQQEQPQDDEMTRRSSSSLDLIGDAFVRQTLTCLLSLLFIEEMEPAL